MIFGLITQPGLSQSEKDISKQLWLDVNPVWFVNPNLEVLGDVGLRKEFESKGISRFVVRPGIRYHLTRGIFLTGGMGSFYTFNEIIANRWEIRPYQGFLTSWPRGRIPVQHYLRLEERFDFDSQTWNSANSIRLRYRLRPRLQFSARQPDRFWRIFASIEGFVTLAGEQGQSREQVRTTAAVERNFKRGRRLRFQITWQKEGLFFLSDKSVNDIFIRVRFYNTFGRTKIDY
jgi:hypothetical protein